MIVCHVVLLLLLLRNSSDDPSVGSSSSNSSSSRHSHYHSRLAVSLSPSGNSISYSNLTSNQQPIEWKVAKAHKATATEHSTAAALLHWPVQCASSSSSDTQCTTSSTTASLSPSNRIVVLQCNKRRVKWSSSSHARHVRLMQISGNGQLLLLLLLLPPFNWRAMTNWLPLPFKGERFWPVVVGKLSDRAFACSQQRQQWAPLSAVPLADTFSQQATGQQ